MKTIEQIHKELVRDGLKSAKIEANGIDIGIAKIFIEKGKYYMTFESTTSPYLAVTLADVIDTIVGGELNVIDDYVGELEEMTCDACRGKE